MCWHLLVVPLSWILWQILISYCKFIMPKVLKWGILHICTLVTYQDIPKNKYSRVPNKRTGRLLENEKKSHLYALIQTYTFINFQQKVPPICLFPLTLLLIFVLSMAHFDLRRPQKPLWGHIQKLINYKRIFYWNTKQPLLYPIECFQKSHLYVY